MIAPGEDRHAGIGIVDACVDARARSRPRPRCPPLAAARTAHGVTRAAVPCRFRLVLPAARPNSAVRRRHPTGGLDHNMNSTTTTGQPTDTTARARPADPADRPAPTWCTGNGRLNPHHTTPRRSISLSKGWGRDAVNPGRCAVPEPR